MARGEGASRRAAALALPAVQYPQAHGRAWFFPPPLAGEDQGGGSLAWEGQGRDARIFPPPLAREGQGRGLLATGAIPTRNPCRSRLDGRDQLSSRHVRAVDRFRLQPDHLAD